MTQMGPLNLTSQLPLEFIARKVPHYWTASRRTFRPPFTTEAERRAQDLFTTAPQCQAAVVPIHREVSA